MLHFPSPSCSQEWDLDAHCLDPCWNSLDNNFCSAHEASAFGMMNFAQDPYACLALQQPAQEKDPFRECWLEDSYHDVPYWNVHEAEYAGQYSANAADALAMTGFLPCAQHVDEYMVMQDDVQEEIRALRAQQLQLYLKLQQVPMDTNSSPCVIPALVPSLPTSAIQHRPKAELGPVSPPKAKRAADDITRPGMRKMQTLSASLQALADEDPDCLFVVRRINKLGFKAVRALKRHFSAHGRVVKVLLAHSTVRQSSISKCLTRRRPSSLGFVHMASSEGAQKIVALGSEQEVGGVMIRVQRFERQSCEEEFDEEQSDSEEGPSVVKLDNGFDRQISEEESESEESPSDMKFNDGLDRQISDASTSAATTVSNQTADSGLDSDSTFSRSRCNSSSV